MGFAGTGQKGRNINIEIVTLSGAISHFQESQPSRGKYSKRVPDQIELVAFVCLPCVPFINLLFYLYLFFIY